MGQGPAGGVAPQLYSIVTSHLLSNRSRSLRSRLQARDDTTLGYMEETGYGLSLLQAGIRQDDQQDDGSGSLDKPDMAV